MNDTVNAFKLILPPLRSHKATMALALLALSTLNPQLSTVLAQGTAFSYQGRLNAGGVPANGSYDLKFTVYDALADGNAVGGPLTNSEAGLTNGLFTVALDFGSVFDGNARWLEIGVRTNGAAVDFTTLSPRQPLTPAPYALYAPSAGNAALLNGQSPTAYAPAAGSPAYVAKAGDTMTGALVVPVNGLRAGTNQLVLAGGSVGIGTSTPQDALLDVEGDVRLNLHDLLFREGTDRNHGLGWRGLGHLFGGVEVDGPVAYGWNGGGLGSLNGGERLELQWNNQGNVIVDPGGLNTNGLLPGLSFGANSGEGLASKRTTGGNQWGLDFYTGFQPRLSLTRDGKVGIGTTNPQALLEVAGTVKADRFETTGAAGNEPPSGVTPILNMVWIKPGTFVMGSPTNEQDRLSEEGPQTVVTLTRGFWMGHHEVTQGEFQCLMSSNPSSYTGDLSLPVETVTWFDATNFCRVLTQREQTAGRLPTGWGYRLPTEAEWEYCCRALTTTRFYYGDDPSYTSLTNYAWYNANSGSKTHPVAQKLANAWGLVDMHGNVNEWCQDRHGPYPGGSATDPQGPGSGSYRVFRGGGWGDYGRFCRSADRGDYGPSDRGNYLGFRVVLAPGQ